MPPSRRPGPSSRLVAVDVARCLALLGILVNHLVGGMPSLLLWDVHAVLFATLVGVGAHLGTVGGRASSTVRAGVVRAGVLAVVGLALADLGTRAAIVLLTLAVVTLVATWAARRPTRTVLVAAAVLALVSPALARAGRAASSGPGLPDVGWSDLADPPHALATLLWATSYPAAVWPAFGLLGVAVARAFLPGDGRPPRPVSLALAGGALVLAGRVSSILVLAVTGRTALLDAEARAALEHSGLPDDADRLALVGPYLPSTPSLLVSGGLALLVLAAVCAVCRLPRVPTSPPARALADLGSMTLSAYTLHVLLLPPTERVLAAHPGLDPWWVYAAHVGLLAAVLLTWRRVLPRPLAPGPLEWLTRRAITAVSPRSGPTPDPRPARRRA
ncbi:DUF418 domain-containing protein [Arsenicicoccus sp. oral taxon 190]|uniref:DUF418 domain-containing protein n=1 Tax=Arsenicicoccus sp. oral taxon 190 TaxID=1658671 RepID=UPI000679ECF8|nr:DUF418 domain-containing protein [Arsenicicoccus sp. oral taxon 190]AKT52269.1 hypothetical protein ADJ73_15100 [Arsenicicoccus sp. oral taxon 190]